LFLFVSNIFQLFRLIVHYALNIKVFKCIYIHAVLDHELLIIDYQLTPCLSIKLFFRFPINR